MGEPEINFKLNPGGAALFAQVTRENIENKLAIVLDGTLYSAPVIKTEIPGGSAVIEGGMEIMEAAVLASAIESPMSGPLKIVTERPVDPEVEQAYRRREWLRPLLLALGALAVIGAVLAGLVLLLVRRLRAKPSAPAPPVSSAKD